ncbi:MAG: diphthine--ammonia ligase [Nanobdellota archaeon]
MCGITGFIGKEKAKKTKNSLQIMKNRGLDNTSIWNDNLFSLGHNLHSIVGSTKQPIENEKYVFATNCEIYNWKELNEKYNLKAKNDAEVLFKLLITKNINEVVEEIDGVYAFCIYNKNENKITLSRDIIGVKPLFYTENPFSFSSERKTLQNESKELNPRQILEYNIKTNQLRFIQKEFFQITPEIKESKNKIIEKLEKKIINAVKKRISKKKLGILFSGGIDSTIIAYILKKNNIDFTCYTSSVKGFANDAQDLVYAKKIAEEFKLPLKIAEVSLENLEPRIKKVSELIESSNVTKVGVALPFYFASEKAMQDGVKVLISGLGSEEIFAGYERHAVSAGIGKEGFKKIQNPSLKKVNSECLSGLMQIHERDLYRDDVITMFNKIELRLPLLDKDLIQYALRIPPEFKISEKEKKIILRDVSEKIGIPEEYARRPKKAAQYGSKFDKAIEKLAKNKGYKKKSEYLSSLNKSRNIKLGALISTGKDGLYAAYTMKKRNYDISCFMTIKSDNKDSYMFHTPAINLAEKQANLSGIPLVDVKTKGTKEKELEDLRKLLRKAKKEHQIEGVVSGAIFSDYQRERIEKICDEEGLVSFIPLWHKNQKEYMDELLKNGFKFIFTKVMCEGLDEKWVGKEIDKTDIRRLEKLNEKTGINLAGEGGEFETLVLDCPLFKKKIKIKNHKKIHDPERHDTVTLDIEKVEFIENNNN